MTRTFFIVFALAACASAIALLFTSSSSPPSSSSSSSSPPPIELRQATTLAPSPLPTAAPAVPRKKKIAICIFGLVKNMVEHQTDSYHRSLYQPLWNTGFTTHTILHTFRMTEFTNKRNGENAGDAAGAGAPPLEQNESIALLTSRAIRDGTGIDTFEAHFSEVDAADEYFGSVDDFLSVGDPWPDNPRVSLRYFLRQQFSLLQLSKLLQSRRSDFAGAVFVRPDMIWYDKLDVQMFQWALHKKTRIVLPSWFLYPNTGFNDRFAYGHVDVMILYSKRGTQIREYSKTKKPHAEAFLRDYLCQLPRDAEVHLARTARLARVRLHGGTPDREATLRHNSLLAESRWRQLRGGKYGKLCPRGMWRKFDDPVLL